MHTVVDEFAEEDVLHEGRPFEGPSEGFSGARGGAHEGRGGSVSTQLLLVTRPDAQRVALTSAAVVELAVVVRYATGALFRLGVANDSQVTHAPSLAHELVRTSTPVGLALMRARVAQLLSSHCHGHRPRHHRTLPRLKPWPRRPGAGSLRLAQLGEQSEREAVLLPRFLGRLTCRHGRRAHRVLPLDVARS